jgi:hypothetical protein
MYVPGETLDSNNPAVAEDCTRQPQYRRYTRLALALACILTCVAVLGYWLGASRPMTPTRAPEADQVLRAQTDLPFQVLIPGLLPAGFDRAHAELKVLQSSAVAHPIVQIGYRSRQADASVFVSEWIPISPTLETLVRSRPIETKWGRGYLLADPSSGQTTAWADIGALRVAIDSPSGDPVSPEIVLAILNSMGPAANQQVSSMIAEQPVIREAAPPPPIEITLNEQGIQELTLVATASGYVPARFSVRKEVPVKLIFRELGNAACASELVFPADPLNPTELRLSSAQDTEILEFVALEEGDFTFHCVHDIYRGVMTVRS